jgi:outer membrane protein assembly factor BamB
MRRCSRLCPLVLLLLLATMLHQPAYADSPGGIAQSDWPMYQHDARHTGRSSYSGITTPPTVRWVHRLTERTSGQVAGNMSIATNGTVYASAIGRVYALDPSDGATLWETNNTTENSTSTPAVAADQRIYWGFGNSVTIITPTGQLVGGLAALNGNFAWGSSPVIGSDGSVYFNHDALWAMTQDGQLRWFHAFGGFSHASPAIGPDGTIYTSGGYGDGRFLAFASDGTVKWIGEIGTIDGTPSVGDDGTVYMPSGRAKLAAYTPDGTLKWLYTTNESFAPDAQIGGAPTIGTDGSLYFSAATPPSIAHSSAHVYALTRDGALRWKISLPSSFTSSIALDRANTLYACDSFGACYAISANGELLWKYTVVTGHTIRTTPLLLGNNRIWLLDELAYLYELEGSQPTLYVPLLVR